MCENGVKPTVDSDTCTLTNVYVPTLRYTHNHHNLTPSNVRLNPSMLQLLYNRGRRRDRFKWPVGVQFCRGHARSVRLSVRETLVLVRTRRDFKKKPADYFGTEKK